MARTVDQQAARRAFRDYLDDKTFQYSPSYQSEIRIRGLCYDWSS